MADLSIRPLTVAEEAQAAAVRFLESRQPETNPYAGTGTWQEQRWRSAYEVALLELSSRQRVEA